MRVKEIVTIVRVHRVKPGRIHVIFACGEVRSFDLKRYARKGTVFESLADPAYASKYRIADRGHALRWPGGEDFSAGALLRSGSRVEAVQQVVKVKDAIPAKPLVVAGPHKIVKDARTIASKKQRAASALKAKDFTSKPKPTPAFVTLTAAGKKAQLSVPQVVQLKQGKKKSGAAPESSQKRK